MKKMVLNEMKLLVWLNFADFASDVKRLKDIVDFWEFFFKRGEDRCAVEGAGDIVLPVPALFPDEVLIFIDNKFFVVIAIWY